MFLAFKHIGFKKLMKESILIYSCVFLKSSKNAIYNNSKEEIKKI